VTLLTGAEAFDELQARLSGSSTADPGAQFEVEPFSRLGAALLGAAGDAIPDRADLAALIRHSLRHWGASTRTNPSLKVSRRRYPDLGQREFARHGLQAHAVGEYFLVKALPWRPSWLTAVPDEGVDHEAVAGVALRPDFAVEADPFFRDALGYPEYRSPAQRAALRAVVDAPAGSTLAVVLPTGEGKSACFYTAGRVGWLDRGQAKGTLLVVTPTVALALDHERNASAFGFSAPRLAFQAGEPDNHGLIERLRDGSQGILFASPEAALGPLLHGLRDAAASGLLSALVVDEAHLVDAWGGVFRPDFQLLSGLFRELIDASPDPKPRSLLLTATLTATAASVLRALFVPSGQPLPVCAAPTMRPEHSYWCPGFVDSAGQEAMIDEAVAQLPRPLILYATSKSDVIRHYSRLVGSGYKRIGWMTGDSAAEDRRRLLERWAAGTCDIVVATSAFGLGVNNSTVRAVVHACVPEGIDRFYQEVGRSGRDGRAAISLLIPTLNNLREGEGLARQKLISPAKGHARWDQMFMTGTYREGGGADTQLDLEFDVAPGADPDRIDMLNEQSTKWNLRVVSMMAIARLISIRRAPSWVRGEGGQKAVLTVAIEDPQHRDSDWFEASVRAYRLRVAQGARRSMQLMAGYVRGEVCIGDAVAEQYRVGSDVTGTADVSVRGSCPGCPACRGGPAPAMASRPFAPPHPWPARRLPPALDEILGPDGRLVVLYSSTFLPIDRPSRERRRVALQRLTMGTFRAVRMEDGVTISPDELQRNCDGWPLFFAPDPIAGGPLPPGPTIIIHAGRASRVELEDWPADIPLVVFATSIDDRYSGTVRQICDLEDFLLR
jgi:superfamily II DNA/RNA helicase